MADQKDEEKRQKGMIDALNKGIAEANGTLSDKELVLIKRAKKKLKAVVDAAPGAKTLKGAISDREQKMLDEGA